MERVLVVGVGNTVMKDDGLGVHALEELRRRGLPGYVDTVEAGTALLDALPDLCEYGKVVFLDAVRKEGEGIHTVRNHTYGVLPERGCTAHEMGIEETLRITLLTEGVLPETVIMGVTPEKIEFGTGLSENVAAKIPALADAVLEEITNKERNPVL